MSFLARSVASSTARSIVASPVTISGPLALIERIADLLEVRAGHVALLVAAFLHYSFLAYCNLPALQEAFHHPVGCFP
jgi:hypothetical protein